MKRSKLTAVTLAAAFALSFSACSKNEIDPTEAVETTASTVAATTPADTIAADTTPAETVTELATTVTSTENVTTENTSAEAVSTNAETADSTEEATGTTAEETKEQPTIAPRDYIVTLDTIDVFDYIDLSDVKTLEVKANDVALSEAYVKYNVGFYLQEEFGYTMEEQDRPVEAGDTVVIDYVGSVDGVEFEGGKDEDAELGIGSGRFIPGFEEGIIGKKTGDTFDLPVKFPEDYGAENLAGKDAVFKVTIKAVKAIQEVTDDMIKEKSEGEYDTLKAYADEVEDELRTYKHDSVVFNKLMAAAKEKKKHEGLINEYVQQQYAQYDQMCALYGVSRADFFSTYGYSEEEIEELLKSNGADYARQKLLILGICRQEGYEVGEDDIKDIKKELIEEYGLGDEETLMGYLTEEDLKYQVLMNKFQDYVTNFKVVD